MGSSNVADGEFEFGVAQGDDGEKGGEAGGPAGRDPAVAVTVARSEGG